MDANPSNTLGELETRSSRQRVTRQHTLERVRNNQRRHRARRRNYIAELEKKLGEAERHATLLQQRVQALEAELSQYRDRSTQFTSAISQFSWTDSGENCPQSLMTTARNRHLGT